MSNDEQKTPEQEQPVEEAVNEAVVEQSANAAAEPEATAGQEQSPAARIEALEEELAKTKDDALRTLAEAQNIRRRSEQDVEKARKFALEKFAGDLLAVVDNLERAIDLADKDNEQIKPMLEGIELTQKSLIDTLAKHHVEQLDPAGEPFDPQFHQAMSMVENPDVEPNTVTLVMQKGYVINERLLRPAMVMVSKAASAPIDEQA